MCIHACNATRPDDLINTRARKPRAAVANIFNARNPAECKTNSSLVGETVTTVPAAVYTTIYIYTRDSRPCGYLAPPAERADVQAYPCLPLPSPTTPHHHPPVTVCRGCVRANLVYTFHVGPVGTNSAEPDDCKLWCFVYPSVGTYIYYIACTHLQSSVCVRHRRVLVPVISTAGTAEETTCRVSDPPKTFFFFSHVDDEQSLNSILESSTENIRFLRISLTRHSQNKCKILFDAVKHFTSSFGLLF